MVKRPSYTRMNATEIALATRWRKEGMKLTDVCGLLERAPNTVRKHRIKKNGSQRLRLGVSCVSVQLYPSICLSTGLLARRRLHQNKAHCRAHAACCSKRSSLY